MSVEEAEALVAYQQRLLADLDINGKREQEEIPDYSDIPELVRMEERMDAIIQRYVAVRHGHHTCVYNLVVTTTWRHRKQEEPL